MKTFLKKYLTEDQIKELTTKYIVDHAGASELPVYITKERLDEVLGQKKTAEEAKTATDKLLKELQEGQSGELKKALEEAQKTWDAAKKTEIDALKADHSATEAIYGAKGRNVKAIKALIDPTKKIDEEIARLKKDEGWLFGDKQDIPPGTGKKDPNNPGDNQAELNAMRKAVGLD